MTNLSKTIIFFGTDDFSLNTLQGLIDNNYKITAVVTKPDSKSGRGQKTQESCVKKLAQKHNIPVWQPQKIIEITDLIKNISPKPIGILVSFGKIIPKEIIELFEPGIINIHPSLLPKYRGPSPIESAIKNGDQISGITIIQLSPRMDAGPIYKQVEYKLSNQETGPELYKIFSKLGCNELISILPKIITGDIKCFDQEEEKATYCSLLKKEDSFPDFIKINSKQAERIIRAHLDFPKTKCTINNFQIIITKAHVSDEQKYPTDILCSDGKYISIDELIAPSGKTLTNKNFINGYLNK